jgi:signal transduction histidine kinase
MSEPGHGASRRAELADAATRWPLRRIIGVGVLVIGIVSAVAVALGAVALHDQYTARARVIDDVDPAIEQALSLDAALVDQETGVRGYALAARPDFLAPYNDGRTAEDSAVAALRRLAEPGVAASLDTVQRLATAWRAGYATPTIEQVTRTGRPDTADPNAGKAGFDDVRAAVSTLRGRLTALRTAAVASMDRTSDVLVGICVGIAVALLLIVVVLAVGLRTAAIRPLSRLAAETKLVSDGDFAHRVGQAGPREVRELAVAVDVMRERILHELSAVRAAHASLDARTRELECSNSELEQFAYVASHDLQEPLRKVASFCQLLRRRYAGQLDEQADRYIEFAVDGAKRMQVLINDLLAFSRVGRVTRHRVPTSCDALVVQAEANLSDVIERTGATIESGELPVVLAEAPLLTTVFQNLIGNALKFHGDEPPHVMIDARPGDAGFWLFSVADNGIGIESEYAERIFVIFQRLYGKDVYPGTGIGLAMCRKIIEYHGGTIWLDTGVTVGARFRFTLPGLPEDD